MLVLAVAVLVLAVVRMRVMQHPNLLRPINELCNESYNAFCRMTTATTTMMTTTHPRRRPLPPREKPLQYLLVVVVVMQQRMVSFEDGRLDLIGNGRQYESMPMTTMTRYARCTCLYIGGGIKIELGECRPRGK